METKNQGEAKSQSEAKPAEAVSKDFLQALEKKTGKTRGRSVLIVDDDATIRRMVNRSMTSLDKSLKVHEAENGREALDVLQTMRKSPGGEPVLIVTDLQMPVMDGWDFIDLLWKECEKEGRTAGIPVIVLSASTGQKGLFWGKSVHGEKCKYNPLVAIAKEDCIKPMKYDAQGEEGLAAWVKHFLR